MCKFIKANGKQCGGRHKSGDYCHLHKHVDKDQVHEQNSKNAQKNVSESYTQESQPTQEIQHTQMPPQSETQAEVVPDVNLVSFKGTMVRKGVVWLLKYLDRFQSYGYKCDLAPDKIVPNRPCLIDDQDVAYVSRAAFYQSLINYNAIIICIPNPKHFIVRTEEIGKDLVARLRADCDIQVKIHFVSKKKAIKLEEDFVEIIEDDGSKVIYGYDEEYVPPPVEITDDDRFVGTCFEKAKSLLPNADAHRFDQNIKVGKNGYLMTRIKPSSCAMCDAEHQVLNTLLISINKAKRTASWKCSLAKQQPYVEFYKERTAPAEVPVINSEMFDKTFASKLCNENIMSLLTQMDKSWAEFKSAMCDQSFDQTEIAYWADKHCTITNCVSRDFNNDFRTFERLLKSLNFKTYALLMRFVMYFISEFYIFSAASSKAVYIRAKPTELNKNTIRDYDINDFKNISIKYTRGVQMMSVKLSQLLTELPYHKFDGYCYKWNHDPADKTTFSLAAPFQATVLDEPVSEEDLLPEWLYYMKTILCYNDEEKWVWLRSYLANLFHQPDQRTGVMLLLYSPEKRVGKSTFEAWLEMVFGSANIGIVNSLSQAFGERGAPQLLSKKIAWFEELTDSKQTFRACMDKMKTAITDSVTTYRKLYQEVNQINNTNEYIAATNHLVGVLADRFTVLRVNPERKDDNEFYGRLRRKLVGYETNKIITYLKDFTTQMPMQIIKTKEYNSMLTNSSEHIVSFINDIKADPITLKLEKRKDYQYVKADELYTSYKSWCLTNGEKDVFSQIRFKEKMIHYGGAGIESKRLKIDKVLTACYVLQDTFFTSSNDENDEEDDEDN